MGDRRSGLQRRRVLFEIPICFELYFFLKKDQGWMHDLGIQGLLGVGTRGLHPCTRQ